MSWSTCELRVRLARRETGLSPVKYFTDRSKAVLLLWIFYVFVLSCICYVFVHVCLYVLCDFLLGKGWPLGSGFVMSVSLSLSHWYPRSGVVLDCIDSWSLHPYLLSYHIDILNNRKTAYKWLVNNPYPKRKQGVLCGATFYRSIFFYSGYHIWSLSKVSVLEFCMKKKINKQNVKIKSYIINCSR